MSRSTSGRSDSNWRETRYVEPIIDHIETTVKDMSIAVPFYDKLLPLLGFDVQSRVSAVIEEHEKHVVQYSHPRLGFAITSPRRSFVGDTINRRKHRRCAKPSESTPSARGGSTQSSVVAMGNGLFRRLEQDWALTRGTRMLP